MRFKDICDQDTAIDTLRRAIAAQKVSHAYLFTGPPGVGKHLTARALAMNLNCLNRQDDACGTCRNCRKILEAIHPDLFEVSLPNGKRRIPIDLIRDTTKRLDVRPHEGMIKMAIIDPAEQMSEPAANALLKTLEEPRFGSYIILITSQSSSLLPTIRSRCQIIRFRPLPENTVARILESEGVPPDRASIAAAFCAGSMEQAFVHLSEELDTRLEAALTFVEAALDSTPQKGMNVAALLGKNRDDVLALLDLITTLLAEVLWHSTHSEDNQTRVLSSTISDRIADIANRTTVGQIGTFTFETHSASEKIQRNNMNPQLALEGMLMSLRGRCVDRL